MTVTAAAPAALVERLTFTYAGREEPTLRDISCSLAAGSWTLVTGPTGSGKSTLLRALAGLIPRHSAGQMQGRVLLAGDDTRDLSPAALARHAGLLLQSADDQLCATTTAGEVAFGLENLALPVAEIDQCVRDTLTQYRFADRAAHHPQQLSGGEKQRLLLASIAAMRPRVLVLDEPLSQLDPCAARELLEELERLRQTGVAIVIVEHRLDDVFPHADRVLVLDQGRLIADLAADQGNELRQAFDRAGLALPEVTQLAWSLDAGYVRTVEELLARPPLTLALSREGRGDTSDAEQPRRQIPIVHAQSLAFAYLGAARAVWQDVTFSLHEGERVAIVGPNGSGKSTLLGMLAGTLQPSRGSLRSGDVVTAVPSRETARNVAAGDSRRYIQTQNALVMQNPDLMLFCGSVREELAFGPEHSGVARETVAARVASVAQALDLQALLDDPPQALSHGQRLRTAVAATLALAPWLLLLDEPTTGQDPAQVARVLSALVAAVQHGDVGALVFSTHDLRAVARYADRVLVLAEGQLLADGTPKELLADDKLLAAARLRRPPLLELRQRLGLRGTTVAELARELRP